MNARRLVPLLLLGSTFLFAAIAAQGETPAAPAAPDGKALFTGTANKCNTCHTIKAAGIEKKKAEATDEETKEKTDKKPPDLRVSDSSARPTGSPSSS
jgi:mono/diheme cytochrome c family protein